MKIKNSKLISINLSLFYFFYFAMVGVYVIFMPQVLKDLGYDSVEIGLIYTASPMMRFLVPFAFKKYFKLDSKLFIVSSILTFLATLLFFVSIKTFVLFVLLNLFYGAVSGIILPFADIIALENIGKERYGKIRLWGSVGFSAIAFVLGNILDNYHTALLALSMTAFFTLIFGFLLIKYDNKSTNKDEVSVDNSTFSLSKYWAFWISVFLFQLSFGGFYNFFTIYETTSGLSLDIVSYLWIFGVICEIVMLITQGGFIKENNLLFLILISIVATSARWLIVAFFPGDVTMLLIAQSLHALGFALYYSASITYIYKIYTQKVLAQQFFLGVGFGLGGSLGALIAGVIYHYSPKGLFVFEAFVVIISVIMLVIHKKRVKSV